MTEPIIILGGLIGGRQIDTADPFEVAVDQALGPRIRYSDTFAAEAWGTITGVYWFGPDGLPRGYTYRAAGDIVAAVRGFGDYCQWYCSGPVFEDNLPSWITEKMAALGWRWVTDKEIDR